MKLIVGAAFALGVVLGGGQTWVTNLVADDVSSVDELAPAPDSSTETDDPRDSTDSTDSTGADGPAEVNYGQLVTAWLDCATSDDGTGFGTRPHPPGLAMGFDAAHSKDRAKTEHKHGGAKAAHGKDARH
jgi:hypothetical protein